MKLIRFLEIKKEKTDISIKGNNYTCGFEYSKGNSFEPEGLKCLQKFIISILILGFISGCNHKHEKSIKALIQAVPINSGFKMDGYWVWGGSVIKVDSTYHMFASRWPKGKEFPVDYFKSSEIVRATSKSIVGPYKFQEVIIGERDSSFWDSNMAHNPTIYKIGKEYVLFYIGSDFTTMRPGSNNYLRRVGYATASKIEGPWIRAEKPIIDQESNNPAVLIDGHKIKLLFRDQDLRVVLAEADNFKGPYKIVNNNVWPESKIEDFYLFKMNNLYHIICEDNAGTVTGHFRWGAHLYSENGINNWKRYKDTIAYDHDIKYTNDSILHCKRRERPQLLIENDHIIGLMTAVYNGKESWCQPVELFPPFDLNNK